MEEMTRVSATPARGASLPPSERTTPVQRLNERSGSCGNLRACDFGEKIRQLEAIGNRLRGEVDVILHDSELGVGVVQTDFGLISEMWHTFLFFAFLIKT